MKFFTFKRNRRKRVLQSRARDTLLLSVRVTLFVTERLLVPPKLQFTTSRYRYFIKFYSWKLEKFQGRLICASRACNMIPQTCFTKKQLSRVQEQCKALGAASWCHSKLSDEIGRDSFRRSMDFHSILSLERA